MQRLGWCGRPMMTWWNSWLRWNCMPKFCHVTGSSACRCLWVFQLGQSIKNPRLVTRPLRTLEMFDFSVSAGREVHLDTVGNILDDQACWCGKCKLSTLLDWHIWGVSDNEVNAAVKKRDHAIGVPADLCVCNGHHGHVWLWKAFAWIKNQCVVVHFKND